MRYGETIEYLYGLQKYGMKFGLDNIRLLAAAAGDPQKHFRSVHIGGTNGKGSTSAMIESMLRTSGATTGLFTSPHLVNFTERIRLNGEEITEAEVVALADEVRQKAAGIEDLSPTFFEVVAAMAFLYFKRRKADWAVFEVGLGGRLDATNILAPEIAVIASIGYDHCEFLGRTLKEIAAEKAGIIKESVPVVAAGQDPEALVALEAKAAEKLAPLFVYGRDFSAGMVSEGHDGIIFRYRGERDYGEIHLPLAGAHQMINASVAIKTIEVLSGKCGLRCDVAGGLGRVRWPGRLEMVKTEPPVLIDGAHNPQAALSLSKYLEKMLTSRYRRIILVAGIMADKDMDGIMRPLLPQAAEVIFTAAAYGRAASPDMLAARASAMGYASRTTAGVAEAMQRAEELRRPGDLIVVTGSFYTIGEAKEALGTKGVLSRLRE